ncbi:Holliday junction branch migration protein RuvA [Acidaminococcus intestini]|jgi:Holliday junction DNA helicase RuvA|uniref:Holliday junction branch migration protein RuvA n=1 Tax=Acidaminococcus intestini TaxID=187327 RepID=UPI0022E4074C|nr:Holliday junction branch migration protein RuvA [Acidaminococcus intestini]
MIGFIKGRVDTIGSNYAFVETQGVGYRIYMNTSDLERMVLDDKVKVYTYLAVREDALTLYGFLSQEAYGLFTKLITVSGIGPKVAQGILSASKVDDFLLAIKNRDVKFLTKLPGIGKKTAERMLLELKDLTGPEGPLPESNGGFLAPEGPASALTETMEALASLGYTQNEISGVMNRIKVTADMSAEDLLKKALQVMARRG